MIKEAGLSLHTFKLEAKEHLLVTHLPTGFYFKVLSKSVGVASDTNREVFNLFISYTPLTVNGVLFPNQEKAYAPVGKWDTVPAVFTHWVALVKKESEEPDMWADLERNMLLFDTTADNDDVAFTNAELRTVQAKLREAARQIAGTELPSEAIDKLTLVLEQQATQSESLTKKEWKMNFVAAVTSAVIGLALNPTQAHDVFAIIKSVFSGLFLN